MIKRGTIVKDTSTGPGLLAVDGNQYPYTLHRMWKSSIPPRVGMHVDVTFSQEVGIESVVAVTDIELVRDQTDVAPRRGTALARNVRAKVGVPNLLAWVSLVIGWFFLSCVQIRIDGLGFIPTANVGITFWQLLSHLGTLESIASFNPNSSGNSVLSLLGIVALASPFVHYVWRDRRASLAGFLPLLLMVIVTLTALNSINNAARTANALLGSDFGSGMESAALKMVHIGIGAWLSLLAGIWFGYNALREFFVSKA